MRCLQKDPALRPQSAREILDAIAVVATPPTGDVLRRWRGHTWVQRTVLAGAGLFAVALVVYMHGPFVGETRADLMRVSQAYIQGKLPRVSEL